MKKVILASVLAVSALAASAYEVGVTGGRDARDGNPGATTYGLTVGQKWNQLGATVGYERVDIQHNDQNRWSLVGSYDFTKVGPVTLSAKLGGAYLDNKFGPDGYATLVGVGASMPVNKNVTLTADVRRQMGQTRVEAHDGNTVLVGVKDSF